MRIRKVIMTVVAMVMAAALAAGCAPAEQGDVLDTISQATLDRYGKLEIREYQGMRLDPAVGPRDNSISGVQTVDIGSYTLSVTGLVSQPLTLTYDEVLAFEAHQRLITLYCVEGWDATILWKGVRLMDLIDTAGVQDSVATVIFKSVDGYTTSLPLDVVEERDLLLAYSSNGTDLPPEMGYPFIVVAQDKLGYKWARWVNEIELSDDENYLGYWEIRGYSDTANVDPGR